MKLKGFTGETLLAYKLLVNDRAKFAALLRGHHLRRIPDVEMMSMFAGILQRSSATVINIGAKVWVMDPAVDHRRQQHPACPITCWTRCAASPA